MTASRTVYGSCSRSAGGWLNLISTSNPAIGVERTQIPSTSQAPVDFRIGYWPGPAAEPQKIRVLGLSWSHCPFPVKEPSVSMQTNEWGQRVVDCRRRTIEVATRRALRTTGAPDA